MPQFGYTRGKKQTPAPFFFKKPLGFFFVCACYRCRRFIIY